MTKQTMDMRTITKYQLQLYNELVDMYKVYHPLCGDMNLDAYKLDLVNKIYDITKEVLDDAKE